MAKLFPFRGETEVDQEPRLVNLDDETADDVFAALSSDTARAVLRYLYEEPATASDVADAVDTSLQNARYHLDKLQSAGLIEDVDTWYSSRGTEMTVYAPTNEPLVVAAGREESKGVLKEALTRVIGAIAVLAVASALVDRLAGIVGERSALGATADGRFQAERADATEAAVDAGGGGGGAANATPTPTPTPEDTGMVIQEATDTPTATAVSGTGTGTPTPAATSTPTAAPETVTEAAARARDAATPTARETTVAMTDGGLIEAAGSVPPGVTFFAGGLLVVAMAAAWWYWSRYRPMYG